MTGSITIYITSPLIVQQNMSKLVYVCITESRLQLATAYIPSRVDHMIRYISSHLSNKSLAKFVHQPTPCQYMHGRCRNNTTKGDTDSDTN